jgi:hypothetical protein
MCCWTSEELGIEHRLVALGSLHDLVTEFATDRTQLPREKRCGAPRHSGGRYEGQSHATLSLPMRPCD